MESHIVPQSIAIAVVCCRSSHQDCSSWGGSGVSQTSQIDSRHHKDTNTWLSELYWVHAFWEIYGLESRNMFFLHKVRDAFAVMFLPQVTKISNNELLEMPKMHPMQSAEGVDTRWLKRGQIQFYLYSSCINFAQSCFSGKWWNIDPSKTAVLFTCMSFSIEP